MKKWIALLLVVSMMLTLTGCEGISDVLEFCGELGQLLSAISTMPLEDPEPTEPGVTGGPTEKPTAAPTDPATEPTAAPTTPKDPTAGPTEAPTAPTSPSEAPTTPTEPPVPPTTPTEPPVPPTDAPTAPPLTELEALWEQLSGCWVGDEDRYVFFTYLNEGPGFRSGTWWGDVPYGRDAAVVTSLTNLGSGLYTLGITYPPVSGDAADSQDLQPMRYTLALDISNLNHGIVRVEAPEDTWRDYTWGGYSYDDAYDSAFNVQYATFTEMQEFWQWLVGYWNSDDGHFVCFDQKDSNSLVFMHGIWNSGSRGWADFEKAMSGYMDLPMDFIIYYPPVSNELDGDLPYEYVRVSVDWMEVETHSRIYVQIGENGDWVKYTFAGYSESDAHPN